MRVLLVLAFIAAVVGIVVAAVPTVFLMPVAGWIALALALFFLDALIGDKITLT